MAFLWYRMHHSMGLMTLAPENLYLMNNSLAVILKEIFARLTQVSQLSLGNNNILGIEHGCFSSQKLLCNLHLYNNRIFTISSGMLHRLDSLSVLYLNDNIISVIESGSFLWDALLGCLHLENNRLSVVAIRLNFHIFKFLGWLKVWVQIWDFWKVFKIHIWQRFWQAVCAIRWQVLMHG